MARKKGTVLTAAERADSVSGKLTPEVLGKIIDGRSAGLTIEEACHAVGVSSVAFHRFRRLHPDSPFQAEWAEAEELFTCKLEEKATRLALYDADARFCTMLIFMLKARRPDVYRENVKVESKVTHEFASDFATAMAQFQDSPTMRSTH